MLARRNHQDTAAPKERDSYKARVEKPGVSWYDYVALVYFCVQEIIQNHNSLIGGL